MTRAPAGAEFPLCSSAPLPLRSDAGSCHPDVPPPISVEPAGLDVDSLLKGAYLYAKAKGDGIPARIMASGVAVPWALKAQEILADQYGVTDTDGSRPDCWGLIATHGWGDQDPEVIRQHR